MAESRAQASKKGVQKKRGMGIYMQNIITRKVTIPFRSLGSNITETIQDELSQMIEGHCEKEGYIKPTSTNIINYSAGCLDAENVSFIVSFECLICRPVEGMRFRVTIKNITKAGIRAETQEIPSPVVVFIARDHHFQNVHFSKLKVGDDINVRVIGIRYELNDNYIAIIAEFVPSRPKIKTKPVKIVIGEKET
tara:strand:- start:499 stop:1080 length:582 start_codon:yes stop_codon:yes gene_type:complete